MRDLQTFPCFHKVHGKSVLVAGGGGAAAAKVRLLRETTAEIVVVAPDVDAEMTVELGKGGVIRIARAFVAGDVAGRALVFAATGDEATDRRVQTAAKAAGIPVNVVDRPELCDFYTPAIVNRAPLSVAIGTEGAAPVLGRRVRSVIEQALHPRLGRVALVAQGLRRAVKAVVETGERRRHYWEHFVDGPAAAAILAGREDEGRAIAEAALTAAAPGAGFVWLVGAGPGAADLLTLRAQRALQDADVLVYDKLVPEGVIALARRDAERIYVGKAKGAHAVTQTEINALLVRLAGEGKRVARVKAGDPLVYGRAGEEMQALRDAGIAFQIIPGVTAAFAAAAAAEIPLTLRDKASSLVFVTGHDMNGETLPGWAGVALSGATVAVYMGRTVAGVVAARLVEAGLSAATPAAAIERAAQDGQRVFAGTLADLSAFAGREGVDGPVLILIGDVVAHGALAGAEPLAPPHHSLSIAA